MTAKKRGSAVSAEAVRSGIYRAAFRARLAWIFGSGIFGRNILQGRSLTVALGSLGGQCLDSMKRGGDCFLAGLWPPKVAIHFDEEILDLGIGQRIVAVVFPQIVSPQVGFPQLVRRLPWR